MKVIYVYNCNLVMTTCGTKFDKVIQCHYLIPYRINPFPLTPAKTASFVSLLYLTPDDIILVKGELLEGKWLTGAGYLPISLP